jgi:hypothetical protein
MGEMENGELLKQVEAAGFEVLVTTTRISVTSRTLQVARFAIVVLGQGRWTLIEPHIADIIAAVNADTPGSFVEVEIPDEYKYKRTRPVGPTPSRTGVPPQFVGTSSIAQSEGAGTCEEWFP